MAKEEEYKVDPKEIRKVFYIVKGVVYSSLKEAQEVIKA